MVDVASMILGEFQDSLVGVFGSSFGWLIGHLIVLSVLTLVILSIRNRDHIISESGYGSRNLAQALAVVGMTAAQYVAYTGNLGFPSTTSLILGFFGALSALWMISLPPTPHRKISTSS